MAIGRLGIYHLPKLEPVLEILAKDEHGGVVAVAGSALDEICRTGSEYYTFVTDLLEKWVESGDPNLMWAVAASMWRIYDVLAFTARLNNEDSEQAAKTLKNIRSIFAKLVETFDQFSDSARFEAFKKALEQAGQTERAEPVTFKQFVEAIVRIEAEVAQYMQEQLEIWATNNLRAIIHAIRQIALTHPRDMIELITKWLQAEKKSNLCIVGKMAGHQLFHQYFDPEIQLLEERHFPLLKLVKPLLVTDDNTVKVMMRTLLIWLQRPGWPNLIYESLLPVVNRITPEEAAALRTGISWQWLDSDSVDVQRIGKSLIARSYLMEGVPVCMPGQQYGVIALDASHDARINQVARVGHRLYERFDSQVDIYVVRMGEMEALAIPKQAFSTDDFRAEHDRSCLILPPLEKLHPSNTFFTLALTWGPIIDLNDIQEEKWKDHLLIASTEKKPEYSDEIQLVHVKRQILEGEIRTIEHFVREHFSQVLSLIKPDEWWTTLQEHFQTEPTDLEAVHAQLNSWIEQLDNIEHSQHPGDSARIIVCTILWLASKDLSICVKIVKKWFSSEKELPRLIGAACGKTLFRVYAHCEPIPSVETHGVLLELAPLLADKRNWSGTDAVLYAARRWAEEPEWSKCFLSGSNGDRSELIQLIEKVLPEQYEKVAAILEDWAKHLEPDEDEASPPDSVIKLLEQLQLSVAINMRKPLPDLPEGHSYGLIIVDASARDSSEREFFAEIASHVIKHLHEHNHTQLELMVYRMGDDYPVAFPKQEPTAEVLLSRNVMRSRLLCPLFESCAIENVAFVLLLTNNPVLDQYDWLDTHWNERIQLYSQFNDPSWAKLFTLIPKQSKSEDIIQVIVRHIEQKIGV